MTASFVAYNLHHGYIDHWLTAGPQAIPINDLSAFNGDDFKARITRKFATKKSGISGSPIERGPLSEGTFKIGDYEGSWEYTRCSEDHQVDLSTTFPSCHYLRSWAYTQLVSPNPRQVHFHFTVAGPFDVWLNQRSIFRWEQYPDEPTRVTCEANLAEGENAILVRFAGVAAPQCVLILALQVEDANDLEVRIPTLIPSLSRRSELEDIYQRIYLDRDVYASGQSIFMHWPAGGEKSTYNNIDFKDPAGFIAAHAEDVGKPDDKVYLGDSLSLKEGEYRAVVMPLAWEFYESQIRITEQFSVTVMGKNSFSTQPYGNPEERRSEALADAARREGSLFAEIAKMALKRWGSLETKTIMQAVEEVKLRQAGSELTLLGLLGMMARYGNRAEFPQWIKQPIRESALQFRFLPEDSGQNLLDFDSEARQILFHVAEILAGQLYPNQVFIQNGWIGNQHREKGEALALSWMHARGEGGYGCWNSDQALADAFIALSHLIDLAFSEPVWDLASVLLDKLLFSLALNSCKGVYGPSQGCISSLSVKSGLLAATSGITRVMWGMGIFNRHMAASVSAALLERYTLPLILAEIAAGEWDEIWDKEQQAAAKDPVNTVTYRTPDFLLSSAQDFKAGKPGACENIWQATLGPNCLVYTNHPGCSSEKEERQPNYWRGNGILPRVVQWKDVLIALYNLPETEGMAFTHAYFPLANFDESSVRDGWAFGRLGEAYIALTSSPGLTLVETGRTARRELRAPGLQTAWICHLGRAALDGDFVNFQEKILGFKIQIEGLHVQCPTLRGEELELGWEGPFTRNGSVVALEGYNHFENGFTSVPYPCHQMEIKTDNYLLRLDFGDTEDSADRVE